MEQDAAESGPTLDTRPWEAERELYHSDDGKRCITQCIMIVSTMSCHKHDERFSVTSVFRHANGWRPAHRSSHFASGARRCVLHSWHRTACVKVTVKMLVLGQVTTAGL